MICDRCGNNIISGTKCFNCGNENQNIKPSREYFDKVSSKPSYYRSGRLTIFMVLSIVHNIVIMLIALNTYEDIFGELVSVYVIFMRIAVVAGVLDIILCLFILKLKKWAFNVYIGLSVVNSIFRIIALDFISVIFRAVLLYFIFRNDYQYFD